jgi:hypothetical protein
MISRSSVFIFLCLFSLVCHGEIYKWVDGQGNTHYGDKPDADQPATQVNIPAQESNNILPKQENREERRRRLAEVLQEDRLKKKEEKEKDRAQKDEQKKQCIYAKDKLRNLEAAGRLYDLDKDGNRIILSENQRTASIENYRAQIKAHCGD